MPALRPQSEYPALNHLLQFSVIDLTSAEPRQVVDWLNLARHRQIAQVAGLDGGPDFFQGQPGLIGNRNQLLAPGRIRPCHYGHGELQTIPWKSAGQRVLDRGEADHFTADLRKTLEPTKDEDEAVVVDSHDVAGVVPAVKRLKLRVRLGVQVAAHDVRSAHEQPSALSDSFDRFELVLDARQELAGRALTQAHRQVDAQARAAFGRTVSFQNPHAEFEHPSVRGSLLDLFRARK